MDGVKDAVFGTERASLISTQNKGVRVMKTFLLSLLLAALPPWLSTALANQNADVRVVVVSDAGAGSGHAETRLAVRRWRTAQAAGREPRGWAGVSR